MGQDLRLGVWITEFASMKRTLLCLMVFVTCFVRDEHNCGARTMVLRDVISFLPRLCGWNGCTGLEPRKGSISDSRLGEIMCIHNLLYVEDFFLKRGKREVINVCMFE